MKRLLEGKVAVVTGSGQGVGRGIALLLAKQGARVVTNNRKPKGKSRPVSEFRAVALGGSALSYNETESDRLNKLSGDAESTAQEIVNAGGEAVACYADILDWDSSGQLIQTAVDSFGRIDILVNNAAGLGFGPFQELTREDWSYQVDAKLTGAFNCMKHAVPHMINQGYGRILNTASDAWTGIASLSAYAAANAGLVALTKSTAKELFPAGITVNAFCPQAESPGHLSFKATLRTALEQKGAEIVVDEDRMKASEAAHGPAENLTFLAYLASVEASNISGAVFSITGGGDIALYSEPAHTSQIRKEGEAWTMEELRRAVPAGLLRDYVSIARNREF
ncbi:SDR family NAD(P)-dependent oxidoreductase [Arthrobacter sp. W4I7]|uniref:SDR family NAD(P)-dependent oxidoreductase n=1 Tax=Arthrobacter sp. W4I7 TaxID=3042296 RepID=UPI00277D3930|nr:SDR family NAD(P)-dependent oxidoreductase [Arthrobacter sp. W4I7]MDQ0691312.1 3-oxoacyl-[acyl-carrier protein] reductase [Arthrobacter sp. W4I7]